MNERTKEHYIKINVKDSTVLSYKHGQQIQVDYLESNLGHGLVPFFICPHCGKKRRELYLKSGVWSCYKCHGLVYKSQQRTKNNPRYWYHKAEMEARKIDPDFAIRNINDVINYEINFPLFKPKHMKQSKFDDIRFWYGMYMYRGITLFKRSLLPSIRFLEHVKENAKCVKRQLREIKQD